MKKSILSLAVAAGIAGTATAQTDNWMHINHNGTGEALVFPLYTAQNGNDTYISVVNTTGTAKAVKVRVLEAENSNEVIDFNLYMSPEDHFSFAVTATAEGGAKLVTRDNTCTVPAIPDAGNGTKSVDFRALKYAGDKGETFDNTGIERTQIGHIEVIEMGQIVDGSDIYDALLHDADGMPADCGALVKAWSTVNDVVGPWKAEAAANGVGDTDFYTYWNGGGLYGYGQVVNVATGTAFGYDAVAISDAVPGAEDGFAMHYPPGTINPNFTDPAFRTRIYVDSANAGLYQMDFLEAGEEILAVSALFQTTEIANDYVVDAGINATTDWVITQPTKFYHTQTTPAVVPYNYTWNGQSACEPVVFQTWDREEANVAPVPDNAAPDFSPAPPPPEEETGTDLPLCYETTLVQFGEESAVNASDVVVGVNSLLDYSEGWASISFDGNDPLLNTDTTAWDNERTLVDLNGVAVDGLPVTGFAVIKYTNSSANEAGALANYAVSTEHKTASILSLVP